jgi:hypothetical protein
MSRVRMIGEESEDNVDEYTAFCGHKTVIGY